MKISVSAARVELTPDLREYAEKKISAVGKVIDLSDDKTSAHVMLARTTSHHKSGDLFRADVRLDIGGTELFATAEESDVRAALDRLKDELLREAKTWKGRRKSLIRRGGQTIKKMIRGAFSGGDAAGGSDANDEGSGE